MTKHSILTPTITAVVYGILVLIAELTLGNPGFPYWLWRFVAIAPLFWSVPVHAVGFVWLYTWTVIIRRWRRLESLQVSRRLMLIAVIMVVLIGTGYFLGFEALNLLVLGFFSYSPAPFGLPLGAAASFWLVIALYLFLSLVTAALLLILPKLFERE